MSRQVFVITVTGEMDQSLRDEFADVGITVDHSVTRLRLVSADASALHGLLNRIARSDWSCSTSIRSRKDHPIGGEAASPDLCVGSPRSGPPRRAGRRQ